MQSLAIGCCQLQYITSLESLSFFCVASSTANPDNELSERQSLRTVYKLFLSNSVNKDKNNQAAFGYIGTALGVSSGFEYFKVCMIPLQLYQLILLKDSLDVQRP